MNENVYKLEEIIEINNALDKAILNSNQDALNNLLNEIKDKSLIDSTFVKYFNVFVASKDVKKARWFLITILPFVSFDGLLLVFKDLLRIDFFDDSEKVIIFNDFLMSLSDSDWKSLVNSGIYTFQAILLSQAVSRDLSFYWLMLSQNELELIRKDLHLKPFFVGGSKLKTTLTNILRDLPKKDRIESLKKTVVALNKNINPSVEISFNVISTIIQMVYEAGGINEIKCWQEYLDFLNESVFPDYRFNSLEKFSFNFSPEMCLNNEKLLAKIASDLKKYFIKDLLNVKLSKIDDTFEISQNEDFKI